jgi:hypothetical protein
MWLYPSSRLGSVQGAAARGGRPDTRPCGAGDLDIGIYDTYEVLYIPKKVPSKRLG